MEPFGSMSFVILTGKL